MALPQPLPASVVTLGTFDGVHRGHQALVKRAVDHAQRLEIPALVYTFHPNPAKVLAPKVAPKTLMSLEERVFHLLKLGVSQVIAEPFDRDFSQIDADDWVERYLVGQLSPRHVVVGFNFSYGRGRGGNPEHLRKAGTRHGFSVDVVEAVKADSLVASSTEIRQAVSEGKVDRAAELLGRPYSLIGTVEEGQKLGRTLGFPTANLFLEHEQIPALGVYACRLQVEEQGEWLAAVANIGSRPTVDGTQVKVEVHALDWSGNLYGRRVKVALVERLRNEKKFAELSELKMQIDRDAELSRTILNR